MDLIHSSSGSQMPNSFARITRIPLTVWMDAIQMIRKRDDIGGDSARNSKGNFEGKKRGKWSVDERRREEYSATRFLRV